jgi:hypothetical protein
MIQNSDRLIVGVGPFDPGTDALVEPDYSVQTCPDDSQYTVLMHTEPAYLSRDNLLVLASAP